MPASSSRRASPTSCFSRRGPSACAPSSSAITIAIASEQRPKALALAEATEHSNRGALSSFALSGQLLTGAKHCWPHHLPKGSHFVQISADGFQSWLGETGESAGVKFRLPKR